MFIRYFTNKWLGGMTGPCIPEMKSNPIEESSSRLIHSYFPICVCCFAMIKVTQVNDQVLYCYLKHEQGVSTEKLTK